MMKKLKEKNLSSIVVEVDTTQVDKCIKKVKQLNELLDKTKELVDSLFKN